MILIDCFTFFNEVDLLEVRMHTLAPYVDGFVISEANRTFQGAKKDYTFPNSGFVSLESRRVNRPVNVVQTDLSMSFLRPERATMDPWSREHEQRRELIKALKLLQLSDDDRIILSDLDEIPLLSTQTLHHMQSPERKHAVFGWLQDLYYYWVNMRCWKWTGPVSCTWKTLRETFAYDLQALREFRGQASVMIDGGWHFSYLGGAKAIERKIKAFSHTEFLESADPKNIEWALREGWKENRDVFGRNFMRFRLIEDDAHLPRYLQENKHRFSNWWYNPITSNQESKT